MQALGVYLPATMRTCHSARLLRVFRQTALENMYTIICAHFAEIHRKIRCSMTDSYYCGQVLLFLLRCEI